MKPLPQWGALAAAICRCRRSALPPAARYPPSPTATMTLLSPSTPAKQTLHDHQWFPQYFTNAWQQIFYFLSQVRKHFLVEFPHWWQSCCNLRYLKLTNSDIGLQPCSSNTRFDEYTCDGDIGTNENAAASSEAGKGDQRTPVVTLEVQGCHKQSQHMELSEKASVDEEMPTSVYFDAQNSFSLSNGTPILKEYTCDGDIPANEDTATSNDDNGRYRVPSKEVNNVEIGLIVGSTLSETGHDDITTDVSLAPTVECTNNSVSEAVYSTPSTVACLKSRGSCGENLPIASNKKMKLIDPYLGKQPVERLKKKKTPHKKFQSGTRSPGTTSPVSYVHWSPLTRDKAASLSMSTPEALKLKRTKSGRVIVPKLDEGCQSIVYGRDGYIEAVIGLDWPAMPKWSESKTNRRKNRRTK